MNISFYWDYVCPDMQRHKVSKDSWTELIIFILRKI